MEAPAHGQIIIASTFTDSLQAFDSRGRVIPVLGYRKLEISGYAEYGVTDWLTAIAAPTYESVWSGGPPEQSGRGPGWSQAGARFRLLETNSQTFAIQPSLLAPNLAERFWGANSGGFDLRLLHGAKFELLERPAFTDLQIAYRDFGGKVRDELRIDATFGLRPWPSILLLAQSFNIIALPRGVQPQSRSHKLQISAVYDVLEGWSVQAGAFASILGTNAGVERGVLTAIWRRF